MPVWEELPDPVLLFDVTGNHLVPMKEDELLNLIQCSRETPVAEIDVDQLERLAQRAKRHWMGQRQIGQEQEVSRVCALYLVPEGKETGLGRVLEGKV